MVEKMVEENVKEQLTPDNSPVMDIDRISELTGIWTNTSRIITVDIYSDEGTYIMSVTGVNDHLIDGKYLLSEESEHNRFYANGSFGLYFISTGTPTVSSFPDWVYGLNAIAHDNVLKNEAFVSIERLSLDDNTRERIKTITSV